MLANYLLCIDEKVKVRCIISPVTSQIISRRVWTGARWNKISSASTLHLYPYTCMQMSYSIKCKECKECVLLSVHSVLDGEKMVDVDIINGHSRALITRHFEMKWAILAPFPNKTIPTLCDISIDYSFKLWYFRLCIYHRDKYRSLGDEDSNYFSNWVTWSWIHLCF